MFFVCAEEAVGVVCSIIAFYIYNVVIYVKWSRGGYVGLNIYMYLELDSLLNCCVFFLYWACCKSSYTAPGSGNDC